MHSCRQCSRQVNSITPQHHNTTSLNTCCKYLMRTLKILQHLIIYLAFEIHIFMAPTGDHTTYTTNPFWCPTMQCIGVAGSFSGGGQPLCPAKIQSFPAKNFSCKGGAKFPNSVLPSCCAKLLCQTVLQIGKNGI